MRWHPFSKSVPARILFLVLTGWLVVSGCQPYQSIPEQIPYHFQDWKLADLRVLQNPPEQIPPELALVGLYAREKGEDIQIRVDFLASQTEKDCDLYLFLDTQPGGGGRSPLEVGPHIQWDFVVILPAGGPALTFRPDESAIPALIPRISADRVIGDLMVTMKKTQFPGNPGHFQIEAYSTVPRSRQPAGAIGPAWNDATPPHAAPILLAFWNTLPAATPVQTLRRWDGAHTGPLGQRHGLKELIEASAANDVPVTLLDLKKPASLQALETLDALPRIQALEANRLLLLPEIAWGDPEILQGLGSSRGAALQFGFKPGSFLYGSLRAVPPQEYRFIFARLQDPSHLQRRGNRILIPLPAGNDAEFDLDHPENGLTVAARRQLIAAALTSDRSDLLVLGGSLPDSLWGDTLAAALGMGFLGGHPWIQVLDRSGLETLLPAAAGPASLCPDWTCLEPAEKPTDSGRLALRRELEAMPLSPIRDLAWDSYLRLTDPDPDPKRAALNQGYLPELQPMIRAAAWSMDPRPLSTCTIGSGSDGSFGPACFLANQNLFLVIDPVNAVIRFAFGSIQNTPVQLIGPTFQEVLGSGDPADWQPGIGVFSDPLVIPGAFWEPDYPGESFLVEAHPGEIVFTRSQPPLVKRFRLDGTNLTVRYNTRSPIQTTLLLLVNQVREGVQSRYREYDFAPTPEGWRWGIAAGPQLEISTNGSGEFSSFLESRLLLKDPENPDRETPPGHYLPFPFAVIHLTAEKDFWVTISIQ